MNLRKKEDHGNIRLRKKSKNQGVDQEKINPLYESIAQRIGKFIIENIRKPNQTISITIYFCR